MHNQGQFGEFWRPWEEVVTVGRPMHGARAAWLLGVAGMCVWFFGCPTPVAGSSPMAPMAQAAEAAQAYGVVFGQAMAEAEVVLPFRTQSARSLARLAIEGLQALPERTRGIAVHDLRGVTDVSATGSGGTVAEVQENAARFDRATWLSLTNREMSASSATTRAVTLALTLERLTGRPAMPFAGAQGTCPGTCGGLGPVTLAGAIVSASGAHLVESAGGPNMAVVFGDLPEAASVNAAGRELNIEVVVTRTPRGLLVKIGEPFVPPGALDARTA